MRSGVLVTIGRREFWANLEWETIPVGADRKERLREIRATVGSGGLYCQQAIPSHDHVAIGYAASPSRKGRAAARPSLAAAVANAEKDPWIGVFCLSAEQDLWWMVAVTEGHSIIVGGDVVGTQAEVLAAREEIKGYEKDWQFFEGDTATIQEFLAQGREVTGRAPPLVRPFVWRPAVWQVAAVVAAVGGMVAWHGIVERQEAQAQAAALRAALLQRYAQQHQLSLEAAARARARPWRRIARPRVFVHACLAILGATPDDWYGWTPVSLTCSLSRSPYKGGVSWPAVPPTQRVLPRMGAVLKWQRTPWGSALTAPPGTLSVHGNTLVGRTRSLALPRSRQVRPVASQSAMRRALLAWAQLSPVPITVVWQSPRHRPAQSLPGAAPKPHGPPADSSLYTAHMAMATMPFPGPLEALAQLPGVRVTRLTVRPLTGRMVWRARLIWWSRAPAQSSSALRSSVSGKAVPHGTF